MPIPYAQLAMVALPTIMGLVSGNKKDKEYEDLINQLKKDSASAYSEQVGAVNSAYQNALNKAYGNLARSGLSNTGIANSTLAGMTQQRGMALANAKANATNQQRQNRALMARLIQGYDDGSGMWGQLAGYGLSGLMQGMFNQNNPAMDWKKIFENMFQNGSNYNVYDNMYIPNS